MKTTTKLLFSMVAIAVAFGAANKKLRAQGTTTNNMVAPMIGVNGLMYGRYPLHGGEEHSTGHDDEHDQEGLGIQEVEFAIASPVDSYLRMATVISYRDSEWGFEDLYIQNLERMYWMHLKAGRFFPRFGAHNHVRLQSLPFANRSLHQEAVFGEGGFLENGFALNIDFPIPRFDLVLDFAWLHGENEALFRFDGGSKRSVLREGARSFRLMALFEFGTEHTLEGAISGIWGRNNFPRTGRGIWNETSVSSYDLTYKWLDAERKGEYNFLFNFEWMLRTVTNPKYRGHSVDKHVGGLHALAQYKLLQPIYAQYRYAVSGSFPNRYDIDADELEQMHSFGMAFVPTKRIMARLQYDLSQHDGDLSGELIGQASFSVGAHEAHSYTK